jgi:hypothetical protein
MANFQQELEAEPVSYERSSASSRSLRVSVLQEYNTNAEPTVVEYDTDEDPNAEMENPLHRSHSYDTGSFLKQT